MRKTWGLRLAIVGFVMMMLVILFDLHGVNVYATEPNSNKEATDVLQVTVPTEVQAALMADGTVVTPQGLQIQNHENVPILMNAYTDTDYGHAVNYTLDVDGVRVLSRTDRVDSNSNSPLEFGGQTSKVMTMSVSQLTREKHAVLMDEAANGVADVFRLGFRFSVKEKKAFAVYSVDDNALVFYKRYDTPRHGEMFDGRRVTNVYENVEHTTNSTIPWTSVKSNIRSVRFVDEVQPTDTANWFKDFTNCTLFDLNHLNTSLVSNMSSMFNNCRAMTNLDLSMLSLDGVTNMGHMLYNCASLETINFGSVDMSHVVHADNFLKGAVKLKTIDMSRLDFGSVQNMSGMFAGCNALEMIKTPRVIGRPRIDGITSKVFYDETNQYQKFPIGQFPTQISESHTLVSQKPYTYRLVDGETFRNVLYQHVEVGPNGSGLTGMQEFVNRIIFVDDISKIPDHPSPNLSNPIRGLDADGDGSVVGYLAYESYTVVDVYITTPTPGQKVIANENCSNMFASEGNWYRGTSHINVTGLDTSNVTNMRGMFKRNRSREVELVGLNTLDTSSVTDMSHAFEVTYMGSYQPKVLDISNWDLSQVTNFTNMLRIGYDMTELRLPANVPSRANGVGITDAVWYDKTDNYREYVAGTVPVAKSTSHTLVKERPYTISYDATGGVMPSEYPTSYFSSVGVETLPTPTKTGFVFDGWYEMGGLSSITVTSIGNDWSQSFVDNSYTNSSFSGSDTGSYTLQFAFDMPEDGVVSAVAEYLSYGGESSVEIMNVRVNGQPSGSSVKKGRCDIMIDIFYTNGYTRGESIMLTVDAKTQSKTQISSIPVGTTGDKHLVAEWTPREVTPIKGFVRIQPEAELTPGKTSASIVTTWEAPADAKMAVKSFEIASDENGTNAKALKVTDNVTTKPIWGKYLRKVMYDESGQYSGELDSGWVGPMTAEFFGTVDIVGTSVVHNRPSYEVNGPIFTDTQIECENYHVIWEIADDDKGTNGMTHVGLTNGGYLEHEDVGKFIRVVVIARSPFSQYVTGQITSAWVKVKDTVSLNEVPMLEEPHVEENEEPMVEPEVLPDTEMESEDETLSEQPPVNETPQEVVPQEEIPSELPEATIPETLPEDVLPEEEIHKDSFDDTPETMQEEPEVVPAVWTTTKPIQATPLVEKQAPMVIKLKNYEEGGMWL